MQNIKLCCQLPETLLLCYNCQSLQVRQMHEIYIFVQKYLEGKTCDQILHVTVCTDVQYGQLKLKIATILTTFHGPYVIVV